MIKWLLFISLLLGATAQAAEINIRSGAHPGFDRIVVDIPTDVGWSSSVGDNQLTVNFEKAPHQISVKGAFAKIDRQRIADVSADDTSITVRLECACSIRLFEFGADRIVIDVGLHGHLSAQSFPNSRLIPNTRLSNNQIEPSLPLIENTLDRHPKNHELSEWLETARAGLVQGISKTEFARTSPFAAQGPTGVADFTPSSTPRPNVSTHRLEKLPTFPTPLKYHESRCAPNHVYQPLNGDDEAGFVDSIRELREALSQSRSPDRVDTQRKLFELYLRHGFAAEARIEAELVKREGGRIAPVLIEISHVMDQKDAQTPKLSSYSDCSGPVTLWVALKAAESSSPNPTVIDGAAVLDGYNNLSSALQSLVAPRLINALRKSGNQAQAEVLEKRSILAEPVRAGVTRSGHNGDDRELQAYKAAAERQSADAPAAFIRWAEISLSQEAEIDEDMLKLADILLREHRGTRWIKPLSEKRALLYSAADDFKTAVDALEVLGASPNEAGVLDQVTRDLAQRGSTAEFIRLLDRITSRSPDLASETRQIAAQRAYDLGYPDLAETTQNGAFDSDEAMLLAAKIYLAQDLPARALETLNLLEASDGREAILLRAKAYAGLEAHERERAELAKLTGSPEALQSAFRRSDLNDLKANGFADDIPIPPQVPSSSPPTLAGSRAEIEAAKQTRALVSRLMAHDFAEQ